MKKHHSLLLFFAGACLWPSFSGQVNAQNPGSPDSGFGQSGRVIQNLSQSFELAYGCAVLPDGKIIAGGDFWTGKKDFVFASRHLPDGSLDASFANNGYAYYGNETVDFLPFAMTVQPDGKILSAGWQFDGQSTNGFVVRMLPDGSPDLAFGTNGAFIYDAIGASDQFNAIAMDANGRIVVAGRSNQGASNEAVVVRLLANGALDTGFGTNGVATLNALSGVSSIFYGLDVLPNGGLVCSGSRSGGVGIVARFNSDGTPFVNFGDGGLVTLDNSQGSTQLFAVSVQNNSQFVAAGFRNINIGRAFLLVRLLANGTLDNTFGNNGESQLLIGSSNTLRDVLPLANGKILAAGYMTGPDQISRAALVRFDSDGTVDLTFNPQPPAVSSGFYHLETLPDGRILASGFRAGSTGYDLALASFLPDGASDTDFGDTGLGWQVQNLDNGSDVLHQMALGTDATLWTSNELAVQGTYALAHYSDNGNLLSAQGMPQQLNGVQFPSDFIVQPDGKLLFGGGLGADMLGLARWLPDGTPDNSFGDQGTLATTVGALEGLTVYSLAAQNDGKMLVQFEAYNSGNFSYDQYLARFLPDGSPDLSWNSTGLLNLSENQDLLGIYTLEVLPNQKILVGGSYNYGEKAYIARLMPNGSTDYTFGVSGAFKFDLGLGDSEIVRDLAIDSDGRILAAFNSDVSGHSTGVLRLSPNGNLDLSFGDNGLVLVPNDHVPTAYEDFYDGPQVAVQSNGRVLLSTYRGSNADFALYCFLSNGQPDTDFGLNGLSKLDLQGHNDFPTDLLIMPDGGILQGGTTSNGFDFDVALVRYLPNLTVGAPFPGDGPQEVLVYPNPLGPASILTYLNPEPGSVTIRLEDSQGRTVQTFFSGWQPAGEQSVELRPESGLAAGWYVCRVATEKGDVAVKVVVR
ncbi:MAG: T9SS type A sorting domain-containing protein [Saprospiraceae bacterium]